MIQIKEIRKQNRNLHTVILLTVLSLSIFSSCTKKSGCIDAPDVSSVLVSVDIVRVDKELEAAGSAEQILTILNKYPVVGDKFLYIPPAPQNMTYANTYFNLLHDPYIDTLIADVDKIYGDMRDVKAQFTEAFQHIKYYYPSTEVPVIYTMVTGFSNDTYIDGESFVIGLDYYLGEEATYRPRQYDYILKRLQKPYLVPQLLLLYSNYFNEVDENNNTALSEMIYYGKAMQFVKEMMPCVPDSLITGYTAQETEDIDKNESIIWASMLENQFLYETSNVIKTKIIGESPKTHLIGEKCPGRIGRWVGWRIIQSYRENNPDVSLQALMKMTDAQKIFNDSGYKPL